MVRLMDSYTANLGDSGFTEIQKQKIIRDQFFKETKLGKDVRYMLELEKDLLQVASLAEEISEDRKKEQRQRGMGSNNNNGAKWNQNNNQSFAQKWGNGNPRQNVRNNGVPQIQQQPQQQQQQQDRAVTTGASGQINVMQNEVAGERAGPGMEFKPEHRDRFFCLNCRLFTHNSRDCKNKPFCSFCKTEGHRTEEHYGNRENENRGGGYRQRDGSLRRNSAGQQDAPPYDAQK